ncbi:MAG: recombinase family protein [Rhodospirillales bacterium]
MVSEIRDAGATSLRQIADALNKRSIPTQRGGMWSAVQVKRALERSGDN